MKIKTSEVVLCVTWSPAIDHTTRDRRWKGGEAIAITLGGRQQVRTTGDNGENDGSQSWDMFGRSRQWDLLVD